MNKTLIQREDLANYINNTLSGYHPAQHLLPINPQNCIQVLHDGRLLCHLMNHISKQTKKKIDQKILTNSKLTIFHKNNLVNQALNIIQQYGINIIGITADSIVKKNQKIIISLFKQISKQNKKNINYINQSKSLFQFQNLGKKQSYTEKQEKIQKKENNGVQEKKNDIKQKEKQSQVGRKKQETKNEVKHQKLEKKQEGQEKVSIEIQQQNRKEPEKQSQQHNKEPLIQRKSSKSKSDDENKKSLSQSQRQQHKESQLSNKKKDSHSQRQTQQHNNEPMIQQKSSLSQQFDEKHQNIQSQQRNKEQLIQRKSSQSKSDDEKPKSLSQSLSQQHNKEPLIQQKNSHNYESSKSSESSESNSDDENKKSSSSSYYQKHKESELSNKKKDSHSQRQAQQHNKEPLIQQKRKDSQQFDNNHEMHSQRQTQQHNKQLFILHNRRKSQQFDEKQENHQQKQSQLHNKDRLIQQPFILQQSAQQLQYSQLSSSQPAQNRKKIPHPQPTSQSSLNFFSQQNQHYQNLQLQSQPILILTDLIDHHQQFPPFTHLINNPIYNIPINQNQLISQQSTQGYHFQNYYGLSLVVLLGSLRKQSFNKAIVDAIQIIDQKKLQNNFTFYIPDLNIVQQGRIPKAIVDLHELVRNSSGILIATPQYNGTFSAIQKNVIDWLSKSYDIQNGINPLVNKKIGIVSCSYLTQNQIKDTKQLMEYLHCNCYPQPFYINLKTNAFNTQTGNLTSEKQLNRLSDWYDKFTTFLFTDTASLQQSSLIGAT